MTLTGGRGQALRLLAGVAISAVFVVATISRVDLDEVGVALQRVNFVAVALAIPLVFVELVLRGFRWQRLLVPLARIPATRTIAYLAIGYFANSMLPARLGDVARAYLAGRSFGISRLAVLGTVVVERLADGLFILGLVVVLGLVVAGGELLASTAGWLAAIAAAGGALLLVGLVYLRRSGGGRIWGRVRSLVDKVLRGAESLRTPANLLIVAVLTAAAFVPAVVMFAVIASAAGLELTLAQAGLIMGGLALSTSIPAAPGSIGTYEFVGLTIMTTLGVDPATALAVVVLVHLAATLPVALAGLIAAWHLHFRVSEIAQDSEPGRLAQDDPPA